jgi:preprotein translocase subunit SecG
LSKKRKSARDELSTAIKYFLTLVSAIEAIVGLYQSSFLWQAIQTGEPLLVTFVLLQTSWFLFIVFFFCAIVVYRYRRELTKDNMITTGIGILIASFLVTWGIRASYFAVTGHIYPGQYPIEFRAETIVAAAVFFVIGIGLVVALLSPDSGVESDLEMPNLIGSSKPIRDSKEIVRLRKQLETALAQKHTPACKRQETKCRKKGMYHYYMPKAEACCTCSCHR